MKSSLSCTTATALRSFSGWFFTRSGDVSPDLDHVALVLADPAAQHPATGDEATSRWLPGLSLDNFS